MKSTSLATSALLQKFEESLDPGQPEAGLFSPRIIGYGEMSTVFAFGDERLAGTAYKRMPLFDNDASADDYLKNYESYGRELEQRGLVLPEWGGLRVRGSTGRTVLYLHQGLLDPASILHKVVRTCSVERALSLFSSVIRMTYSVLEKNNDHLSLGLDAQLSNWSLAPAQGHTASPDLVYVDTSTPLIREDGAERLDPELFLKVCPQSLVWIIRRFFLQGVLDRYYDFRLVVLDCVANLLKEQRADLIPPFLEVGNAYLKERGLAEVTAAQVRSYYREDAFIWSLFLRLRRWERSWRTLRGQRYELILPGPIRR